MSKLSVIIVNYNVKYFLEQALKSVQRASNGLDIETWVVDNDSKDGSVEMVQQQFPWVKLIANKDNVGFSKANNQAIRESRGEYVLLLNPDTVVQEDTFSKCLAFMDTHPEAGALGIKMVDGQGKFLPESKRSLPTPAVSFYKIFGLSSLFPKSPTFARYHLGHLDKDQNHEIEVLAGAFILLRREALDKAGLLDETFFMYGEDIDLSYRIIKAGYKNYYFADSSIIHYKGESTKKGSLNYVRIFYQAMIIFAKKHFSPGKARLYSFFINIAIVFRAMLTLLSNFFRATYLVIFDGILAFAGLLIIKQFWAVSVMDNPDHFPPMYLKYVVPGYILVWLASVFFSGGYDRPLRFGKVFRGLVIGTLIVAAVFGFLPNDLRYSRTVIILGALWTGLAMTFTRMLFNLLANKRLGIDEPSGHKVAIAGSPEEATRVLNLLHLSAKDKDFVGFISPNGSLPQHEQYIGELEKLPQLVDVYELDEVIFCSRDLATTTIIKQMTTTGPTLQYKIVPEASNSIIGSNSKNTSGDLYAIDANLVLDSFMARRNKRVFDLGMCLILLVLAPLAFVLTANPLGFIKNWWQVFSGKKSWVGYAKNGGNGQYRLPQIKLGVLSPIDGVAADVIGSNMIPRLNLMYAREYSVSRDFNILWRGFRKLGRITEHH